MMVVIGRSLENNSSRAKKYTPDKKYKPQTMRQNGILGKQHGKLVTPFRLLIFEVFLIHGEILEYICQFYSFCAIMMCTVSENQRRFFRFPENHWVV